MRKYLTLAAALGLMAISATDIVPDRVAYFAFGLLVVHWASGELAKFRDALLAIANRPLPQFSPDWDARPSKPILCEPGFADETWERFEYRIAHYETQRDAWVLAEARKMLLKQ